MKILIVRPSPNKMNLSTYNLQEIGLAKALTRKGHECDVMYYCGKEKDHYEIIKFDNDKRQIRILWLHGYGIFKEGIYPSLKKYINLYDLIQVGGHESITSCYLNRKFPNKVINYQGPYFCKQNKGDNFKASIFDKTLLPLSNKNNMIVGTKSILATQYMKSKGIQNVYTLGVGLDLDNILKSSENELNENEFIKLLKHKKKGKYLLYIGVLEERRNIHFMLKVLKRILEINSNYQLIIIGKGKKEYVDSCFEEIDKLNLKENIIYIDCLEQRFMKAVYEIADAFILPTRYEIFGMVLLEAMYFSLPVFTTYNGGSSTLMDNNNGIIINELDENIWANKIIETLSDSEKCKIISKNAHYTIENEYTWDALANKFIDLYNRRLKN